MLDVRCCVVKWSPTDVQTHLYPKVTWYYEPISIQRIFHQQHQRWHVRTCQILLVSASSMPLASSHSIRPCLYMLAMTRVHLSRVMSVSRPRTLSINSVMSLLHSPSSFSICFLFSRSSFKSSIRNSTMRSLMDDISTQNEMWLVFISTYIKIRVTTWSNQLQWHVWTRQNSIIIIIMLLLPYFPTAFAFASCYDLRTTNTPFPFLNPSIRRVTRSLPMKGADTCEWNTFPKNPCFVGSFASFSLSVLLQYHAHPSNGCERTFPIHTHGHTLDTQKPCHQVPVTSSNEAKCDGIPFYLILTTVARLAMRRGAALLSGRHLSDTRIRYTCSGELRNDFLGVHQRQLVQVISILHKIINQFVIVIYVSAEVRQ